MLLLFLKNFIDLLFACNLLNIVIYVDEINLFLKHKYIKVPCTIKIQIDSTM